MSLILTELIAGVTDPLGLHFFSDVKKYGDSQIEYPNRDYYIQHPGSSFEMRGIEYSFNAEGFRDDDFEMEKPDGVIRVLCIGDSMVYGWGVERSAIFTELLENMARDEGFPCEIVNAGACSWGTIEESNFFSHRGYEYNPDILLLLVIVNDLMTFSQMTPQTGPTDSFSSFCQSGGKFSCRKLFRFILMDPHLVLETLHGYFKRNSYFYRAGDYFYLAHKLRNWQQEDQESNSIIFQETKLALREIATACNTQQIRPLFFIGTSEENDPIGFEKFYRDFYSSELEKLGVKPKLCQAVFRSRSLRMSLVDPHPTALGHERIAQAMYPELRSLLLEMTQSEPESQSSCAEIQQNQRDSVSVSRAADSEKAMTGRP